MCKQRHLSNQSLKTIQNDIIACAKLPLNFMNVVFYSN